MFYEMLYGRTPWSATDEKQLMDKICRYQLQFPENRPISGEAINFIRRCLACDEGRRISMQQIEEDPYIIKALKKKHEMKLLEQAKKESVPVVSEATELDKENNQNLANIDKKLTQNLMRSEKSFSLI